eukprot:gnl/TRDRNA2_/TRDRNA2_131198_c0_seq1.p1 gnl/TRDRNA2_/TRDRNA2_131198_c0~~gnl/TRDRNA2_/TRDRNA2_131198_c0_seq1.p1  ORF type:complete len:276 (+),score=50.21 gnl/TRDRNA2_/TRDRNA2_131198_c0_seq1:81-830(+)
MYPEAIVKEEVEICIMEGCVAGVAFEVRTDGPVLRIFLPACYPLEPPQLSLSCPSGNRASVATASQELESIVCNSDAEMECCVPIVEHFLELAAGMLAAPDISAAEEDQRQEPTIEANTVGVDDIGAIPPHVKALVKNIHSDRCKVYIGRPDANPKGRSGAPTSGHPRWGWGNPFSMGGGASRGSVIRRYTNWIMAPERADLRAEARRELRGKTLGCFCAPLCCHGHVLAMIANSETDTELAGCGLEFE